MLVKNSCGWNPQILQRHVSECHVSHACHPVIPTFTHQETPRTKVNKASFSSLSSKHSKRAAARASPAQRSASDAGNDIVPSGKTIKLHSSIRSCSMSQNLHTLKSSWFSHSSLRQGTPSLFTKWMVGIIPYLGVMELRLRWNSRWDHKQQGKALLKISNFWGRWSIHYAKVRYTWIKNNVVPK